MVALLAPLMLFARLGADTASSCHKDRDQCPLIADEVDQCNEVDWCGVFLYAKYSREIYVLILKVICIVLI